MRAGKECLKQAVGTQGVDQARYTGGEALYGRDSFRGEQPLLSPAIRRR